MRTTKIVATLGPASNTRERIGELIRAGVDVVRMNFSHGSHTEHAEQIAMVRGVAQELSVPVAILQDLQGPKIRTGSLRDGVAVHLVPGSTLRITSEEIVGDSHRVSTTYPDLPRDVKAGDRILVSDGLIALRVVETSAHEVTTEVVDGGLLKERQGINLPGVNVSAPAITDKDAEDLAFGLAQSVDFVALSFVRRAAEVRDLKQRIEAAGSRAQVIAKLEKPEAIENIEEILDASDAVMVARGDLGVELSPEKVPLVQKRVIALANARAKPVITATQMLESMIENPRPTRAEASDVANAILDGSDAVMLSGETAAGLHPVTAVETMARIVNELRDEGLSLRKSQRRPWELPPVDSLPEAIGAAVGAIVRALARVDAIWVITRSGTTARLVSQQRPEIPIVAFTPVAAVYRRLALLWGVQPVLTRLASDAAALDRVNIEAAKRAGLARTGDTVVITGSHPFNSESPTNFLKIQQL